MSTCQQRTDCTGLIDHGGDRAYVCVFSRKGGEVPPDASAVMGLAIGEESGGDLGMSTLLIAFLMTTLAVTEEEDGSDRAYTLVPGEKRSENPADDFAMTTLAVGEEDGGDRVRAPVPGAKRSENPADDLTVTTMAIGEEDGGGEPCMPFPGEKGRKGPADDLTVTTMAIGEEDGG